MDGNDIEVAEEVDFEGLEEYEYGFSDHSDAGDDLETGS